MATKKAEAAALAAIESLDVSTAVLDPPVKKTKPKGTVAAAAVITAPKTKAKTAARKASKAGSLANVSLDEDAYASKLYDAYACTEAGDGVVTSEQAEQMVIGLQMPTLAMRYLLQQDVFPLGRNLMLYGLKGASKSALMIEIGRWFVKHKGMAIHIETENKDSPDLRNSLLWYDRKLCNRFQYRPTNSQEEWMEALTGWIAACDDTFLKKKDKKRGQKAKNGETAANFRLRTAAKTDDSKPGMIYPLMAGVDSLTAVSSDKTINKILDEGSPERRFQIEAQLLSDYAKTLAKQMRGKPIVLVTTNHLKPGQDDRGMPVDNIPGGQAMRYMNSTELKMTKLGKTWVDSKKAGNRTLIECTKNSLGQTGKKIQVDLQWWWEMNEETGKPVQRTVWDWDTASIEVLLAQEQAAGSAWKEINEVVDIHVPKSGKKTFWSKTLGIPSSSPVRLDEAGKALEEHPDILEAIYEILHIKERTRFTPGVDYSDLQEQRRRAAEKLVRVYDARDLSAVGSLAEELALSIEAMKKAEADRDEDEDDD